ncbi:MAG: D-alanine--D-alanine ligase [bacterium]|nr:D-alanine--D-alanine ligase [bacterium]
MDERICVLYGGPSKESEVSRRSALRINHALLKKGYNSKLLEYGADSASQLKGNFEKIFNIMHGRPGEDGLVQGLFEHLQIPYTGSGIIPSAITMNKYINQQVVMSFGIPVLKSVYLNSDILSDDPGILKRNFPGKIILKPNTGGSSVGAFICKAEEAAERLEGKIKEFGDYIAEEYVENGTEVTVGIIKDNGVRVLTPLQLVPKNAFYDYHAKYTSGMTDFIIPPKLSSETTERMMKMSSEIFVKLRMDTFARVDFIVSKENEIYELEVNSIPGMTDLSDLPQEAEFDGIEYAELVEKLLMTAGVNKDA